MPFLTSTGLTDLRRPSDRSLYISGWFPFHDTIADRLSWSTLMTLTLQTPNDISLVLPILYEWTSYRTMPAVIFSNFILSLR
ncbi:MAG: hypothetical protein RL513_1365 [Pseudomonadota bacterium]